MMDLKLQICNENINIDKSIEEMGLRSLLKFSVKKKKRRKNCLYFSEIFLVLYSNSLIILLNLYHSS